jgi:hypothetical protein
MTVAGSTMISAVRHSAQRRERQTQSPTVRHRQWHPPRPGPLQHVQLMSQRQELELESRAGSRRVANGQEEGP